MESTGNHATGIDLGAPEWLGEQKVAVCIATYRRPAGLERLLRALPEAVEGVGSVLVIVGDNEPSAEAACVVERFAAEAPFEVRYLQVHPPGIAATRNAMIHAAAGSDAVAFIDDDEVPPPHWLATMMESSARHSADVVIAPVIAIADFAVPAWLEASGALDFAQPVIAEGSPLKWCGTGNALLSRRCLEAVPDGFSESYSLTGGSDVHYFRRATLAGVSIRWSNAPIVTEFIPVERTRIRWLLKRAYRSGTVLGRVQRELEGLKGASNRALRGAGNIAFGTMKCAGALFRASRGQALRGVQQVSLGVGMIAGVLGLKFTEYKR